MLDMYEKEKTKTHGKSFTNVCTSIRLVFVILNESFLIKGSGSSALAHSTDFTKFDFSMSWLFVQTVVTLWSCKWWFRGRCKFSLSIHVTNYMWKWAVITCLISLNLWSIHWHFFYKCQRTDDEWKESTRVTAVINSLAQSHFLVAFACMLWCSLPGTWMFKNHSPLLSSQTVFLGGRGRRRIFWIFEPNLGSAHWTNYFFTGLKIDLLFMSNLFHLKRLFWR